MERKLMNALKAVAFSAAQTLGELTYWHLDTIDYYCSVLDQSTYYDTIKAYKQAKVDIEMMQADVMSIATYLAKQSGSDVNSRIAKQQRMREHDQWDINMINRICYKLDASAILIGDLQDLYTEDPVDELKAQFSSLSGAASKLEQFKTSPFTEICRALDESDLLALTDRVVDVPDEQESANDQALQIKLGADLSTEEIGLFKRIMKKFGKPEPAKEMVAIAKDFKSDLHIDYENVRKSADGAEHVKFSSQFAMKSVNKTLGEATGIVMPAGSLKRRYLDGDYFPEDVVYQSMIGYMLESPQINRDHDEKDLFNFWEHPDFRIVETWQEKQGGWDLGGETVQKGDWLATIRAVSDKAREAIADGTFNGFSVEGWVSYIPDELLSSTQNETP